MIDIYGEALKITNDCENLWSEDWAQAIISLVTRAVADAKLKQMERDVDAVLFHCCDDRPEMCGSHHYVQSIRTAFAATEPRDAGKDDARELGLDGDA